MAVLCVKVILPKWRWRRGINAMPCTVTALARSACHTCSLYGRDFSTYHMFTSLSLAKTFHKTTFVVDSFCFLPLSPNNSWTNHRLYTLTCYRVILLLASNWLFNCSVIVNRCFSDICGGRRFCAVKSNVIEKKLQPISVVFIAGSTISVIGICIDLLSSCIRKQKTSIREVIL